MFCKNCGSSVNDGSKFCLKCGYRFDDSKAGGNGFNQQSSNNYNQQQSPNNSYSQPSGPIGGFNPNPGQMGVFNPPTYNNTYGNQGQNVSYKPKSSKKTLLIASLVGFILALVVLGYIFRKDLGIVSDKNDTTVSTNKPSTQDSNINTKTNNDNSKTTTKTNTQDVEKQLRAVIDENIRAMEDKDVDAYMATLSVSSTQAAQTKTSLNQLFNSYELTYAIESFKVLSTDSQDAQVEVVQTTKSLETSSFRDNRVTAVHHLKLVNGQWKIYKSDIKDTQYLNSSSEDTPASTDESTAEELKEVIQENAAALQDEDWDAYLATTVIPQAQLDATKQAVEKVFDTYDLKYTIESAEVLSTDSQDAQVKVVQVTKKTEGPDFKDNRLTAVHHLKKVDGVWKIYKSDIVNTEYLTGSSN